MKVSERSVIVQKGAKLGYGLVLAAAVLMAGAGCATRGNVIPRTDRSTSEIVSEILAKDLPGVDPAGGISSIPRWREAVERIEEFIAWHPDEPEVANDLRIREAILLVSVGEYNQAAAAFNEIDPSHLSNERDRAFYDVRETLIWWYGVGGENSGFSREDTESYAERALANLATVADNLNGSRSTRRLLGEMRVRIANRLAAAMTDPSQTRAILEDGLDRYAAQFDPSEYPLIQNWNRQEPGPQPLPKLSDIRWYEYIPVAFKQAQAAWEVYVRHGETPLEIPEWVSCMEQHTCPWPSESVPPPPLPAP
jgi:hypothetical protein